MNKQTKYEQHIMNAMFWTVHKGLCIYTKRYKRNSRSRSQSHGQSHSQSATQSVTQSIRHSQPRIRFRKGWHQCIPLSLESWSILMATAHTLATPSLSGFASAATPTATTTRTNDVQGMLSLEKFLVRLGVAHEPSSKSML